MGIKNPRIALLNIGTEEEPKWYHFDACHLNDIERPWGFLMTDLQSVFPWEEKYMKAAIREAKKAYKLEELIDSIKKYLQEFFHMLIVFVTSLDIQALKHLLASRLKNLEE